MKRGSIIDAATPYRASDSYLHCAEKFALRPIQSDDEYKVAVDVLGRLASREDLDEGERDYLAGLSRFVKDYEAAVFRVNFAKMTPMELLRHLMEENDMTTTDLGYVLGSRGLASEVLHGKRGLSKTLIGRLAARFAVDPGLFLERE